MQIVIDIPDAPMKDYQDLYWKIHGMAASEGLFDDKEKSQRALALKAVLDILGGIVDGTPLPKGHGKLKDIDKFLKKVEEDRMHECYMRSWTIDDVLQKLDSWYAPIIIEADKAESEEQDARK